WIGVGENVAPRSPVNLHPGKNERYGARETRRSCSSARMKQDRKGTTLARLTRPASLARRSSTLRRRLSRGKSSETSAHACAEAFWHAGLKPRFSPRLFALRAPPPRSLAVCARSA